MTITINSPNGEPRQIELSKALKAHWNIPINHAQTILDQVNSGMYDRWFKGKKDLTVIDFGANIGLVSLYMLPACKELHCVEPTPKHFELLEELLEKEIKSGQDVEIWPFALSNINGEVVFATGHSTENKITSHDGYGNGKIKITALTLFDYICHFTNSIDFCKVDIEGGEMIALTTEQLKAVYGRVKTFFVEVHPAYNGGMKENMEELTRRFIEAGYKVEHLDYQTIVAEL